MREVVFRNLTSAAARKRDISVEEIVERDGLVSATLKRSIYFVRGVHQVKSEEELKRWVEERKENSVINKKFFHILRKCSTKDNEDKLICKMRGSFYIIAGNSVFNIVFVHAIRIKLSKAMAEK